MPRASAASSLARMSSGSVYLIWTGALSRATNCDNSARQNTYQEKLLIVHLTNLLGLMFVSSCIIIRFKEINQQSATITQVYYLTFMCGSTCFERFLAHHQELTNALGASAFTVGAWR